MTEGIGTCSTMNVFETNGTFNVPQSLFPSEFTLAAMRWDLFSSNHIEGRAQVLRTVFHLISEKADDLRPWCILGAPFWQTDTRILRHKLAKRLESGNSEIANTTHFTGSVLERDGKLNYFRAAMLSELAISSAVKSIGPNCCSYIIAVPHGFDVHALVSSGWNDCDPVDPTLLMNVVKNNGMVLRAFGDFDDRETGFVGLALPSLVQKFAQ